MKTKFILGLLISLFTIHYSLFTAFAATSITFQSSLGRPMHGAELDTNLRNLRDGLDNSIANFAASILAIQAAQGGGTLGYQTVSAMNADLAHNAGTLAIVTNDGTTTNNTYWIKIGTSGSGSWQKSAMPPTLPLVDDRQYADFATAVTAQSTNNVTLVVSTIRPVTTGVAIPLTCRLMFIGAGYLNLSGAGAITGLPEADPCWFGAGLNQSGVDSTPAIKYAINSAARIISRPGTYYCATAIKILAKSGLVMDLPGVTFKTTDPTKPLFQVSGSSDIYLKNFTCYGGFETQGPTGMESTIRIENNVDGTSGDNWSIVCDGIKFLYNSSLAFYIGGTSANPNHRITVRNCKMMYGLCFLMAIGVDGLDVHDIEITHRTTPPPGTGISQDEDIAIFATSGMSCFDINISDIYIRSGGTTSNANTGRPKIDFTISASGLNMTNVSLRNIKITDNLGNFTPSAGYTLNSSIYFTDAGNPNEDGFINTRIEGLQLYNSPGLMLNARNIQFIGTKFDTMPNWLGARPAIDSPYTPGSSGCSFIGTDIQNWSMAAGMPTIYTSEGGVTFNGLRVKNSTGSVWAAAGSIYTNMILDNITDSANGAFYTGGGPTTFLLSNSIFKNNPYTALKDNSGYPSSGTIINLIFAANGTNSDINPGLWNLFGVQGLNPTLASTAWNGPHLVMYAYHLWVDSSGRLRIKNAAPTSDTDGTIVGTQN